MSPKTLIFRHTPNLQIGRGRATGFLEGHGELNAAHGFAALGIDEERAMRANMEHWVAGNNSPTTKFHGFPKEKDHAHCFVFKHHDKRLYGFLCHPRPRSDARFQLCALCIFATKHQRQTDKHELDRVEAWLIVAGAIQAIRQVYPEYHGEVPKWRIM
jgi:hypothetical protein